MTASEYPGQLLTRRSLSEAETHVIGPWPAGNEQTLVKPLFPQAHCRPEGLIVPDSEAGADLPWGYVLPLQPTWLGPGRSERLRRLFQSKMLR